MPSSGSNRPLHIHLLTYHEADGQAFKRALKEYPAPNTYTLSYHEGSLKFLDPSVQFDLIVSPANSYGRMDGGFDDALSRAFSPPGDYLGLTHVVQKKLWEDWRGFAPPGTCTLVPFAFERYGVGDSRKAQAPWGCQMVAVCPTMRTPQDVQWDREIAYECMWTLLTAITKWNETHPENERINSILMTPLATGVGRVPNKRWARQVLLAMQHFDQSCNNKEKWSTFDLNQVFDIGDEVAVTFRT